MHLTHCTRRGAALRRGAAVLSTAVLTALVVAGPARADGDPASDVLAQQALFLPQDAGLAPARQAQLSGLVQEAARSGYPVRVAVIASRADLGSVTELWNQPRSYARFLGQELALVYRGPLVIVMPSGVGVSGTGPRQRPLAHLTGAGPDLGASAITAVRTLAAAAGIRLATPAATATPSTGGTDTVAWLVLAGGAVLIAAAWTASLRARPLGRRARTELS